MKTVIVFAVLAGACVAAPACSATITMLQDSFGATARASVCQDVLDAAGIPTDARRCFEHVEFYTGPLVGAPPVALDTRVPYAQASAGGGWSPGLASVGAYAGSQLFPAGMGIFPTVAACGDLQCRYHDKSAVGRYDWIARFVVAGQGASVSGSISAAFSMRDLDDPAWRLQFAPIGGGEQRIAFGAALVGGHEYLIDTSVIARDIDEASRFNFFDFSLRFLGADVVPVAEPGTLGLLAFALAALGCAVRRSPR